MVDLTQIDALLGIGIVVAFIAIGAGVRGMYSVSADARRDRSNQETATFPVSAHSSRAKRANRESEGRRAA